MTETGHQKIFVNVIAEAGIKYIKYIVSKSFFYTYTHTNLHIHTHKDTHTNKQTKKDTHHTQGPID